ncbi:hypothetical protein B0H13DRAFT_2227817 [Mycena leptocephala]|nr:hypothetical protein B0H13DRAFT_2227817 [Mycena leptocephala]
MEAHHISVQAQFIVDSLPNADNPAVERSTHQLGAVWRVVLCFETFRQIFDYLEQNELLDMENPIHSTCLFLVFQRRIQAALDRARDAWNHHRMRTQHDKTPIAIYELSRTAAITGGYWTGDPGDDVNTVASDPLYGYDSEAPLPPTAMSDNEPWNGGILVNGDEDLLAAKELLGDFDCDRDDGNWGIEVYCEAVIRMISQLNNNSSD